MRPPVLRVRADELVIDNFAGGGGASTGIRAAIGRPVDIAINHDPIAIAMHKVNHPETKHYCENVWEVDPREACGSRKVALAWFSPDCVHFSRARGTAPVKKEIRGLAWVVIRWAKSVRPRVILLENVDEFETWGPVVDGHPDPAKAGRTFRAWMAKLRSYGYAIEFRSLVAADYGAPTTRRRLFLIARCDGRPIVWPEPTHGKGRAYAWRAASEIIDWTLPSQSIFTRERPLKPATLARIATGLRRYVIEAASPFVIPLTHHGDARANSVDEPLRTVTAAHRGEFALVEPFIVRHGHYSNITGAGIREGCGAGTFRGQPLAQPLSTICATNDKHLVCPIITKHYGGVIGHRVDDRPLGTITATDHHALSAAFLTKFYGTSIGSGVDEPMPTVTAGGGRGGGHFAAVRAFLKKHGGKEAQQLRIGTLPLGLVNVRGQLYRIVDVTMRMIQPRELFSAQSFPSDYIIDFDYNGKPLTKTAQTSLAGNSVCQVAARALVEANVGVESEAAA